MLRLIGIVVSIAAADAVNPSTLVPALFLASGQDGRRRALRFGAGVLGAELGIGLILVLGPGELILDLVPKPEPHVTDWLQTAAGTALLIGAVAVWRFRDALRRRQAAAAERGGQNRRPAFLLGAGIVTLGMPTNVAYLGGLTTIISSDRSVVVQLLLLGLYDAVFILPLAGILAVLALAPRRSAELLGRLRRLLDRHVVTALVAVLVIAGAVVLWLGLSGLVSANP